MNKSFILIAAAAAIITGCQVAEDIKPQEAKSFYATISDATRTTIEADGNVYHVYWSENDKVAITDANGSNSVYSAATGGSATTVLNLYSGEEPAGAVTAYYPAEISRSVLPGIQTYSAYRRIQACL